MKKVLIVAYHFPPSNAVGALRPAKFAEYLPEFGWEPIVLAGDEEVGGRADPTRFSRTSAVRVESVRRWPGLRDLWLGLKRLFLGRLDMAADAREAREAAWQEKFRQDRDQGGVAVRLREMAYALMSLPDDKHGWILPAVTRGLRAIGRERPDAILATSPPHTAQVVGMLLSAISGVPLIADFRDPWIGNPTTPAYLRGGRVHRFEAWLEGRVMQAADSVLTVTPEHAEALADRRPSIEPKLVTVTNGFDAETFRDVVCGGSERFTVTYVGSFYHERSPERLFQGVGLLVDREVLDPGEIEIRLVGDCRYAAGRPVTDMAAEAGLSGSVVLTGEVSYRDALAEVGRADLLLLLASDQPQQVPTKAYEYLASGRPTLALVEEGATARLFAEADADVLIEATPEQIASAVQRRMEGWAPEPARSWSCPASARQFERRETTEALSSVLNTVGRH